MSLTLETALKINRALSASAFVAACCVGAYATAEELGAVPRGASPVSEVAYAKESASGFNGLVGMLNEFGFAPSDRADLRTGVQVEVLSMEPMGGCVVGASAEEKLTYYIRSPFPDKRDVYSTIVCGAKPDNMFMEDLADHDGWVRQLQFGTSSAYGGMLGDPGAVGLVTDSPAVVKVRWRWEHKDDSVGPWQTKVFRIGPTDGVIGDMQASR